MLDVWLRLGTGAPHAGPAPRHRRSAGTGQQQTRDELAADSLASIVTAATGADRGRAPRRQPAATAVVDVGRQGSRSALEHRGPSGGLPGPRGRRRTGPRRPSAPRPAAGTASRCRPGRSRRAGRVLRVGLARGATNQGPCPARSCLAPSSTSAVGHQSRCPVRQGARAAGRPVRQRREHEVAVGQRLRPRDGDDRVQGPSASGAATPRARSCAAGYRPRGPAQRASARRGVRCRPLGPGPCDPQDIDGRPSFRSRPAAPRPASAWSRARRSRSASGIRVRSRGDVGSAATTSGAVSPASASDAARSALPGPAGWRPVPSHRRAPAPPDAAGRGRVSGEAESLRDRVAGGPGPLGIQSGVSEPCQPSAANQVASSGLAIRRTSMRVSFSRVLAWHRPR